MTHKNRKKVRNLMFRSDGCSLLRAEGFTCSLGVLYGGIGIQVNCNFLFLKSQIFVAGHFFPFFGHRNPGSELDPDRYSA
jgi:hypothetical protein